MPTADEPKARYPMPDAPSDESAKTRSKSGVGKHGNAPVLARLTMIGWFVAASIAVGAIAGWWLDSRFGSAPAFLIGGVLIGVAVALVGMVRMLQTLSRQ